MSLVLLFAIFRTIPVKGTASGWVTWVCDGDTVYVNINWFRRIKVRVVGKDASGHGLTYGERTNIP